MSFDTQVVQLSSENLDKLFESSPVGSPNANTLAVGVEPKTTEIDNATGIVPQIKQTGGVGLDGIPFLPEEPEISETDPITKEISTEDDKVVNIEDKAQKEVITSDVSDAPDTGNINEVLTNTVDYLIKSGRWVDFEGREDLEVTQEVYADLVAKQDEYRLGQMFNDLVDSTGDYGKAIISHVKNGGNPDEIIDLFKEQRQLQQIDTSTEVGKQSVIEKYYTEVLGWKPEKVERTVKRLITDDEIDTEFSDVKEMYDNYYKSELAKTEEKVREQEQENINRQQTFVSNIKNVLKEDSTLTDRDRKLIESSVFDFKHKLPNGQKVNDFYIKFAELQANPKEYVEFVRYVMDKENYKKSIKRSEKTIANQEAYSFIKGGAALTKVKSSPIEINDNRKSHKGTDFSFALKK